MTPAKTSSRSRARSRRRTPATSEDVARLAGVSRSAVSRTFTPGASVAGDTRKKVLAAAKTLQYRPNLFARSLMTRRSNIVGLAITALDNQYYPDVVQRFSESLAQADFRLLLFITHGTEGHDPLLQELLKYHVDALVLASSTLSSQLAEQCRATGMPVIMFNNVDPRSQIPSVATANERAGQIVAAYLAAAGHKRFGYIAGWPEDSTSYERERGFTTFLKQHDLPAPISTPGNYSFEGAAQAMRTLLSLEHAPDAIFCGNDHMALAALQIARYEFNRQPGRDLSIIGFDNVPVAAWPCFQLTTYAQPTQQMIARTITLLAELLEHESPRRRHERLSGDLIVRQSARQPTSGFVGNDKGELVWRPSE